MVDELFDIKVLDPAMGSGHFLVEAVDYITDKALDFLNAFPWNPVVAHLTRMRETILREMDEQGITIDAKRLTDVNLLKRQVLKRCIYGVDLNPMAVELAKVSLWLDCFTLGAPLSFLDHHLRCGNSLIGVTVKEVREALEGKEGEAFQLGLFGSRFAGLLLATDLMRHVGELSDVTSAQVQESRVEYRKAANALAPFKRILDTYTSQWFGNENGNAGARRRRAQSEPPALSFLKSRGAEAFINVRDDKTMKRALDILSPQDRRIAETVLTAAAEKRFFHWELEFPEVFYGPRPGSMQLIERLEGAGFDAVIGNPPYGDVLDQPIKGFLEENIEARTGGRAEIYAYFVAGALDLLAVGCRVSFITPNTLLDGAQFGEFRKLLSQRARCEYIRDYRDFKVFEEVNVMTMVGIFSRPTIPEPHTATYEFRDGLSGQFSAAKLEIPLGSTTPWRVRDAVIKHLETPGLCVSLDPDIGICRDAGVDYKWKDVGWQNRGTKQKLSSLLFYYGSRRSPKDYPFVKGEDLERYSLSFTDNYLIHDFEKYRGSETTVLVYLDLLLVPIKILTRQTSDRPQAAVDTNQYVTAKSVHTTIVKSPGYSPYYVTAVLNSRLLSHVYRVQTGEEGRLFAQVKLYDLRPLPIRRIEFTTPEKDRQQRLERLTRQHRDALKEIQTIRGKTLEFLALRAFAELLAAVGEPGGNLHAPVDVVHDLLAYLTERMVELNKQKQIESKRFLGWLEKEFRVQPDKNGNTGIEALTGKTTLKDYLGDYQKSKEHAPFEALWEGLRKNSRRLGRTLDAAFEQRMRSEHEKSLALLLPIKQKLAGTDWLIDQLVYRLYGLTEEEIAIVEGRSV